MSINAGMPMLVGWMKAAGAVSDIQLILANHRALKSFIACSRVAEYPSL
jgi:hypothetical protein